MKNAELVRDLVERGLEVRNKAEGLRIAADISLTSPSTVAKRSSTALSSRYCAAKRCSISVSVSINPELARCPGHGQRRRGPWLSVQLQPWGVLYACLTWRTADKKDTKLGRSNQRINSRLLVLSSDFLGIT